ncbi:MAG: hypothetical protein J0M17_24410 [Planctomycetes bacterium]|nr:hypothetical protein [Planctomycetota bacterium]
MTREYQSHAGAVNTGTTSYVEYEYAGGSANTLRSTRVRYPNGRAVDYAYGASGSDNDRLSRVYQLKDGATVLAQYDYLGAGGFVRCDLLQPQIRWNLSPSGNAFSGLDSLDRTVDCLWQKYAPSASTPVQVGYTYDRASNRTSRDVAGTTGNDELYRYDALNRLTDLDRGNLASGKIMAPQAAEQWRLDATGNWRRYENLNFVTPGNSLDQDLTANRANEITGFTSSVGDSWPQPAYDRAGNMTVFPNPTLPTSAVAATYDAWNRLVELGGGASCSYAYDAVNRRTVQEAAGATRHYYYSTLWQVLEERLGNSPDSASVERQYVWGRRYLDDLVIRDRSPNNNGSLEERFYAMQDANWNVVAISDTAGVVVERFAYSAYGTPLFMSGSFESNIDNDSAFDWQHLFACYGRDLPSGLYTVRQRYLNSAIGRWLTRDPFAKKVTPPSYDYVEGAPVGFTDPSGLSRARGGFGASDWGKARQSFKLPLYWALTTNPAPFIAFQKELVSFDFVLLSFPGSISVYIDVEGATGKCCLPNGRNGNMFEGHVTVRVEGSVGTGIRVNKNTRHGTSSYGGAVGTKEWDEARPCEDGLDFIFNVGLFGWFAIGIGFEGQWQLLQCSLDDGCELTFDEPPSGGLVFGLGAELGIYGEGGVEGTVTF